MPLVGAQMATVTWSIETLPWQVRLAASNECAILPDSRCAGTWLAAQVLRAHQDGHRPMLWNSDWSAERMSVPDVAEQLRRTGTSNSTLTPSHLAFLALHVVEAAVTTAPPRVRRSQLWPGMGGTGTPSWRDRCITFPVTNWAETDDKTFGKAWHNALIRWVGQVMAALNRRDTGVDEPCVLRMYWAGWLFAAAMRNRTFDIANNNLTPMLGAIKTAYHVPIPFAQLGMQLQQG